MNKLLTLGLTTWLVGACTTTPKPPPVLATNQHTIKCAEGHQMRGEGPPKDNEQWCRDDKGINQGPWSLWHANGKVAAQGNFRNGRLQGSLKIFDPSGQLAQEYTMLDGKMHGSFSVYWPHGNLSRSGGYFRDQKKGPFILYDVAGKERKRIAAPGSDARENNEPDMAGDLNMAKLRASLKAANLYFEQCYETFLRQDRNLRGQTNLVFWVDTNGFVEKIRFEEQRITSQPLLHCIENALSRTRFPKASIAPVTVEIPLRFSPSAQFDS